MRPNTQFISDGTLILAIENITSIIANDTSPKEISNIFMADGLQYQFGESMPDVIGMLGRAAGLGNVVITIDMVVHISVSRDRLAEYAHEAWSGWMKYLFKKSDKERGDGCVVIPEWAVKRWKRQMVISYKDLPEDEQRSDGDEADKILKVIEMLPIAQY